MEGTSYCIARSLVLFIGIAWADDVASLTLSCAPALGNYLAAHTSWGAYLPQPAVELFAATPTSQYANNPLQGLLILSVWLLVIGVMASLRFLKTDLGGRY